MLMLLCDAIKEWIVTTAKANEYVIQGIGTTTP